MVQSENSSQVTLILGPNEKENKGAYNAIKRIPNVELRVVRGLDSLVDYVQMPYIEGVDGYRYYGNKSIQVYLSNVHNR